MAAPFPTASSFLTPSLMAILVLIAIAIMMLLILWLGRTKSIFVTQKIVKSSPKLQRDTAVSLRPVLTKFEATLYNLLQLAVHDRFLVFAKLPLIGLFTIREHDERARRALLKALQPVRADFVLLHPGTLTPAKVVRLEDPQKPQIRSEGQDRLIKTVLKAAGIELLILSNDKAYTVPELVELLGFGEED